MYTGLERYKIARTASKYKIPLNMFGGIATPEYVYACCVEFDCEYEPLNSKYHFTDQKNHIYTLMLELGLVRF